MYDNIERVPAERVKFDFINKSTKWAIAQAWENFLSEGECSPNAVRGVIKKSWERCVAQDVRHSISDPLLVAREGGELDELRYSNHELLSALNNVEKSISNILDDVESIIMLADPAGVLVEVFGNKNLLRKASLRL